MISIGGISMLNKNVLTASVLTLTLFWGDVALAQSDHKELKLIERLLSSRQDPKAPHVAEWIKGLKNPSTRQSTLDQITRHDSFLKITVKNMASRMSIRSEEVSAPLNDFSATLIGFTRDDLDGRELLTTSVIYIANPAKIPEGITIRSDFYNNIIRSNQHYADIDSNIYRLNLTDLLMPTPQLLQASPNNNVVNLVPNPDPAGLLTTNTWAREHLVAGTNRRAVEFTLRSFLCTPIEKAADTKASDSRIGRDIDRFPGLNGNPEQAHNNFLTSCKGCHTVMDGFRGAFAHLNYDMGRNILVSGSLIPNDLGMQNGIARKYNLNNEYASGYVTTDSSWVNNATRDLNQAQFAWKDSSGGRSPASVAGGTGTQSFGRLVANSDRFALCMAKRAFNEVCQRSQSPLEKVDLPEIKQVADSFVQSGYKLRQLYISAVQNPRCL